MPFLKIEKFNFKNLLLLAVLILGSLAIVLGGKIMPNKETLPIVQAQENPECWKSSGYGDGGGYGGCCAIGGSDGCSGSCCCG
jgi:hypothetical protein